MIEVCSLSSGSNGNSFFIKTGSDVFLVDAGISCKQICLRLGQIGQTASDIRGIFITHEHSDHVRGLRVLLKRFPIRVYITEKTYRRINVPVDDACLNLIKPEDAVTINNTTVRSLPKCHDAVEPTLFSFFYGDKKISVITDIGVACENVVAAVRDAHVLFLESNYDDRMLWDGFYPYYLKKRIDGSHGHLSNTHAGSLVKEHGSPDLEYVFLSHLSENNNTPDAALDTFKAILKGRKDMNRLKPILTSRHEVSPKITIPANHSK